MKTLRERLIWAAAFLEGEGSFIWSGAGANTVAPQVQKEPLERLQLWFGGTIRQYENGKKSRQPIWRWRLAGVGFMMTIYPFMSPQRQQRIRTVIEGWKRKRVRWALMKVCRRGHVLSEKDLRTGSRDKAKQWRRCRECAKFTGRECWKAKILAERGTLDGYIPRPLATRTHCSRGHEFVEGSYYTSNGGRNCKQCVADSRDARRARDKAARAALGE